MVKRLLSLALVLLMLASMMPTAFAEEAPSWYGDGSATEFTISTVAQLKEFAALVNGGNAFSKKTVKLGANLDLNNEEWTPIGKSDAAFSGTFDGQGYTISNLKVAAGVTNKTEDTYKGLFGYTTGGEIKNFTLNNANVTGGIGVGAVSGCPYTSKYTDIKVTGDIKVKGLAYVGGALGRNAYANVTNVDVLANSGSYVIADSILGTAAYRSYVGGLIGYMAEGNITVKNCDVKIDVEGAVGDIGGILGILHYGNTLTDCTFEGAVENTNNYMNEYGALVGVVMNATSPNTISNCTATVTAATYAGSDTLATIPLYGPFYYKDNDGMLTDTNNTIIRGVEQSAAAKIGTNEYATLAEAFKAVQTGETITVFGTHAYPDVSIAGKSVIIKGEGNAVIEMPADKKIGSTTNSCITFETVTLVFPDVHCYYGFTHAESVTYKSCVLNGSQTLYSEGEGVAFIDCTFNNKKDYCVWTYGVDTSFDNCTFNTGGKAILVYNEGEMHATVELDSCTFNSDKSLATDKAAVEVGSSPYSAATTYKIILTDCKTDGNFFANNSDSQLWGNKNSMDADHLTVIRRTNVSNHESTAAAVTAAAKEATAASPVEITLKEAEGTTSEITELINTVADNGNEYITVNIPVAIGSVKFDAAAVAAIDTAAKEAKIELSIEDTTATSLEGKIPTYEITLKADGVSIGDEAFKTGEATVTLPIPEGIETPVVYYVADDGTKTNMNAVADATSVTFTTSHFSTYTIEEAPQGTVVAKIGNAEYYTLQAAIDDAASGQTVTLVADITIDAVDSVKESHAWIKSDDNVVIDLNTHTVTGAFFIDGTAKLMNGTILNTSDVSGMESTGNLTLENMTVTSNRHAVRISGGTATIVSGTYTTNATSGTKHAINISDANVTIKNGTFTGYGTSTTNGNAAVAVRGESTLTIQGGEFSNDGGSHTIAAWGGVLNISGGYFHKSATDTLNMGGGDNGTSETGITGGYFEDKPDTALLQTDKAAMQIADGEYAGWYEIGTAVAKIGSEPYATIQAAVDAVKENETIVVLADNIELPIVKKNNVTIVTDVDTKVTNTINQSLDFGGKNGLVLDGFVFTQPVRYEAADMKFLNCSFTGAGKLNACWANGTWIIDGCTFEEVNGWGMHFDGGNSGTVSITNTTIAGYNPLSDLVTVNFDECTFTKGTNAADAQIVAYGNVTITNSEFDASLAGITDYFDTAKSTAVIEVNSSSYTSGNIFDIVNDDYPGLFVVDAQKADGLYTAGTFNKAPTADKLADGFVSQENENGTFGIVSKDPTVWDGVTYDTSWYNKDGKEFTLTTAAQVAGLIDLVGGKYDKDKGNNGSGKIGFNGVTINLGADIDLAGYEWTPIGTRTFDYATVKDGDIKAFSGIFEGNGHTISNLKITDANVALLETGGKRQVGFIASLGANGAIKNVTFVNPVINIEQDHYGEKQKDIQLGVAIGSSAQATAVIDNVDVSGLSWKADASSGGGVAGIAYSFSNCNVTGTVTVVDNSLLSDEAPMKRTFGGVTGQVRGKADTEQEFKNNSFVGTITEDSDTKYAGYLIGSTAIETKNSTIAITGCTSEGSTGLNSDIGRELSASITRDASYVYGDVTGLANTAESGETIKLGGRATDIITIDEAAAAVLMEKGIEIDKNGFEPEIAEGYELNANEDGTFGVAAKEEEPETETIGSRTGNVRYLDADTNEYNLWMFAGIDSLDYKEVGFIISTSDGRTKKLSTTTVYKSIKAKLDGAETTIAASDFSNGDYTSTRIFAKWLTFSDLEYVKNTSITYKPYAITLDGTEIYGTETTHIPIEKQ